MDTSNDPSTPALSTEAGDLPGFEIDTLARCLLPKIQAYFASPEGQEAFAKWKQKNEKYNGGT